MRRVLALAIIAPFLTAGCADKTAAVSADVAVAEIALTQAERLAVHYTSLPRCGALAPPLCSDAALVQRIKAADQKAYDAVKLARNNEALIGGALSAIAGFTALIPK